MLSKKDLIKCQKMLVYLEIYDKLIEADVNNFVTNRQKSDEAHRLLIKAARKVLHDEDIKG